jgi:hypothetical protein
MDKKSKYMAMMTHRGLLSAVFGLCLASVACGSKNEFDEDVARSILETNTVNLDGEQVTITTLQLDCGVQSELWETPAQVSQDRSTARLARYQSRLLDMVPKAIGVYYEALQSDDLQLAAATATKLLEGMHVLHKDGIEQTISMANRASPESNQNQRRLLMLGQIMDGMLERSRLYDLPLPPDIERVRDELQGTDGPQRGRQVTLVR